MIIMAIDPALTEIGITVYDTIKHCFIYSSTLITDNKIKYVKDLYQQKIVDIKKVDRNTDVKLKNLIQFMWTSQRLDVIYTKIKHILEDLEQQDIQIDYMIAETQLMLDTTKCVSLVNLLSSMFGIRMYEYQPMVWKKILTGKGNISEEHLTNFIHNTFDLYHLTKFMSEHEIDACGMILTHIKNYNLEAKHIRQLSEIGNDKTNIESDLYNELLVKDLEIEG